MVILSILWVIIMVSVASLVWFRGHLPYTGAFFFVMCTGFTLLLGKKWLFGFVGVCVSGILFCLVSLYEPSWLNVLGNLWDLVK
jgi:hypothetical protein